MDVKASEAEQALKTLEEKLAAGFEARKIKFVEQMKPLGEVGFRVRNRKLEWEKTCQQNQMAIYLGNRAAHHGKSLADAPCTKDS